MNYPNRKIILAGVFCFLLGAILTYFFLPGYLKVNVKALPNQEYFSYLHPQLANARESIHLVMFTMRHYPDYPESKVTVLLNDLVNAQKRGVEVKIILEGGEEFLGQDFIDEQKKVCLLLQDAGVEVKFDPEGRNTHAKLVIVDKTVILGSTNWNYYALEENYEASGAVISPVFTAVYENYFWNLWRISRKAECATISPENCSSVAEILVRKYDCDKKKVQVNGTVSDLKFKTSLAGNNYTIFQLISGDKNLRVFTFGHPGLFESEEVLIRGTFHREKTVSGYTYYHEIEAEKIEKLK